MSIPKALSLECDDKGFVAEGPRDKAFLAMRGQGDNRTCFECGARNAPWISTTFAIFLCVNCSGNHRNLGARVSFVRSTELDKTKLEEILRLEVGGNSRAKTFFRSHGSAENIDYRSRAAERYRRLLDKEVQELLGEHRPELLKEASKSVPDFLNQAANVDTSTAAEASISSQEAASPSIVPEECPPQPAEPIVTAREPQLLSPVTRITPVHHFSGGSSAKPTLKARTDDFDFDFESAFMTGATGVRQPQAAQPVASVTPSPVRPATVSPGATFNPAATLSVPKDASKAKSFSSADFDKDAKNQSNATDFNRFRNATAISSDAFFNPGANTDNMMVFEESASAKLSIYSDKAVQKASDLAAAAQESLRSAATWFSRVSSTPPSL
eukprot:Gregarina_sp_Pseudo_9__1487@NODE_1_length_8127_cov_32_238872_g0_i0_p2_GENE_NODE_1_length_8127_cov_32_238872_g0_i0NODE_1_length_8127_cov_32_238872_g0_i0_p2_ORF_typecomplete_len384_score70_14ArfGap/PF01412_18/6_9e26_NODE_1_length_8127_cov_32_238872_g0_i06181769